MCRSEAPSFRGVENGCRHDGDEWISGVVEQCRLSGRGGLGRTRAGEGFGFGFGVGFSPHLQDLCRLLRPRGHSAAGVGGALLDDAARGAFSTRHNQGLAPVMARAGPVAPALHAARAWCRYTRAKPYDHPYCAACYGRSEGL
jgi:hypothetical protein